METIRICEVTRVTGEGRVTYVSYKGRTLKRRLRRGRPSYEVSHTIALSPGDKRTFRDVNVNSQVGRALLAQGNDQ